MQHENPQDCDHSDYIEPIGKMEEGKLDSCYNVSFFCPNCNYFVYETYVYEGIEIA